METKHIGSVYSLRGRREHISRSSSRLARCSSPCSVVGSRRRAAPGRLRRRKMGDGCESVAVIAARYGIPSPWAASTCGLRGLNGLRRSSRTARRRGFRDAGTAGWERWTDGLASLGRIGPPLMARGGCFGPVRRWRALSAGLFPAPFVCAWGDPPAQEVLSIFKRASLNGQHQQPVSYVILHFFHIITGRSELISKKEARDRPRFF
jgi:hypothetical protein